MMTDTIHTSSTASARAKINPIELAHMELTADIARMLTAPGSIPSYPPSPAAEDHEAVRDYLLALAAIYGRHLRKIGLEICSNSLGAIDMNDFSDGVFVDAITGFATFAIEEEADRVREQVAEVEQDRSRRGDLAHGLWRIMTAGRME